MVYLAHGSHCPLFSMVLAYIVPAAKVPELYIRVEWLLNCRSIADKDYDPKIKILNSFCHPFSGEFCILVSKILAKGDFT
jgi:hypothetical protein